MLRGVGIACPVSRNKKPSVITRMTDGNDLRLEIGPDALGRCRPNLIPSTIEIF